MTLASLPVPITTLPADILLTCIFVRLSGWTRSKLRVNLERCALQTEYRVSSDDPGAEDFLFHRIFLTIRQLTLGSEDVLAENEGKRRERKRSETVSLIENLGKKEARRRRRELRDLRVG